VDPFDLSYPPVVPVLLVEWCQSGVHVERHFALAQSSAILDSGPHPDPVLSLAHKTHEYSRQAAISAQHCSRMQTSHG
jgi:hypothetical protein